MIDGDAAVPAGMRHSPISGDRTVSIDNPDTVFDVVVNAEGQYSIWPTYHPVPNGWQAVGVQGDRSTCLAHIAEVWTDMRTKDLREAMGG